jgi:histidine triad (HIT) family protein
MKDKLTRRDFLLASGAVASIPALAAGPANAQIVEDCVFCRIVAGKESAYKLWEDKDFYAFLDHKPINPGHTLLIPKKHFEYVFDLEDRLYTKIFKRAKFLAKPLKAAMASQRVGILVEGFGVDHMHIHLIPINKGDGFGKRSGKEGVSNEEFQIVSDKIRSAIPKK